MKLLITGGTGNAGSGVLAAALASPQVTQVTLLSRRPSHVTHAKLSTILIPSEAFPTGFETCPPELVERLRGHTGIIWALGVSQTQVSEQDYIKITHDYPLQFSTALASLGTPSEPFKFVYFSGEGADQSEKSRQLFGRIKGRTEKALEDSRSERFMPISIRPGAIIPMAEHRRNMNYFHALGLRGLGAVLGIVYPSMAINSADLGAVAVDLASRNENWKLKTAEGWLDNAKLKDIAATLRGNPNQSHGGDRTLL